MWIRPILTVSREFDCTTDTTRLTSASSEHVLWALVPTGTPDCKSNCAAIVPKMDTDLADLWRALSVKLGPILTMISLRSLLTCLLWRSQGIFRPSPPCVFTVRFHTSWCLMSGGRWMSWNSSRIASTEYFVRHCCRIGGGKFSNNKPVAPHHLQPKHQWIREQVIHNDREHESSCIYHPLLLECLFQSGTHQL